jgi:hypothetical protein
MPLSFKTLLKEIIVENSFGKKFPVKMMKGGVSSTWIGIASANTKTGERPYRITWFRPDLSENRHVDLTLDEMLEILKNKTFSPEIIERIRGRYPDSDMIGDEYTLMISSP